MPNLLCMIQLPNEPTINAEELQFVRRLANMTDKELLNQFRMPTSTGTMRRASGQGRLVVSVTKEHMGEEEASSVKWSSSWILNEHFRRKLSAKLCRLKPSERQSLFDFESESCLPFLRL